MTIKSNAPDHHHHFANISNIFLWSSRAHWGTHRAPLAVDWFGAKAACQVRTLPRTARPSGGWSGAETQIGGGRKTKPREPPKLVPAKQFVRPNLDPKTGSQFGTKNWFPIWTHKLVPILASKLGTIWGQLWNVKMGTKF